MRRTLISFLPIWNRSMLVLMRTAAMREDEPGSQRSIWTATPHMTPMMIFRYSTILHPSPSVQPPLQVQLVVKGIRVILGSLLQISSKDSKIFTKISLHQRNRSTQMFQIRLKRTLSMRYSRGS
ncbi:hypothetical protein BS78_K163900 [Paspalum vaginatum]|uniref:Secreted protein n=1 Tax=Paspalum vaginatum TaxID=158149 RepID=A0A9W7XAW7_9POAL|nr:hypothetical protein BS78_K163900 [Paspalum vaginatum]